MKRGAGILMPIFSIPSKERFSSLGKEAYRFVDFLVETNQTYWQVLPINEVDVYGSPFCSPCIYSGNPLFISLEEFMGESELKEINDKSLSYPEYKKIKMDILFKVFKSGDFSSKIAQFEEANGWVEEYSRFMVLYEEYIHISDFPIWSKKRDSKEYFEYMEKNIERVNFYKFCQYLFFKQWFELKKYANDKGIFIIGDSPCNAAMDSKECWSDSKYYLLDENLTPSFVAGVPPDYFSSEGQVWNTLIYNYEEIKKEGYKYLIDKYKYLLNIYDYLKIDHFRGLEYFYKIPYGSENGKIGEWVPGPGYELIDLFIKNGINNLILEDLGIISEGVVALKEYSGYPGMKVFEFAFGEENSPFLPHNYNENCAAYTGTHDNDTFYSFLSNDDNKEMVKRYLNLSQPLPIEEILLETVKKLYESRANVVIINPQDLLMEGNDKRFNSPGTVIGNWQYCSNEKLYSNFNIEFLKNLTFVCRRRG